MSKKNVLVASTLFAIFVLSLVGCGKKADDAAAPAAAPDAAATAGATAGGATK